MPLFRSKKDIDFVIKINQELIEKVIGEKITYYPISKKFSEVNFYNESKKKIFDPPVEIYALVRWDEQDRSTTKFGQDIIYKIEVSILKKHLEDINVKLYEGDVVEYDGIHFEITSILEMDQIFGKSGHDIGYKLTCRSIRESNFNPTISGTVEYPARTYPDEPLSSSFYYDSVLFPFSGATK